MIDEATPQESSATGRFPCEQTFASLMRFKALGVTDVEIKNMARVMDFGPILKDWKNNNGNTNYGWPTFRVPWGEVLTEIITRHITKTQKFNC